MRLVTQTDACVAHFGYEEGIRRIARAGFDGIDLSLFDLARQKHVFLTDDWTLRADDLLALARELGTPFTQAHAPFPSIRLGDSAYNEFMDFRLRRSIEISGRLGIEAIVIHPFFASEDGEEQIAANLAFYQAFEPLLRDCGVKIAVENLWRHDAQGNIIGGIFSRGSELAAFLDRLDPECFTACHDVGHSGLVGEDAAAAVRAIGHRHLTTVHIHDNNHRDDQHLAPHLGLIDWEALTVAFGEINYSGDFTLEADFTLQRQPETNFDRTLRYMEATSRDLMRRIEANRAV
ncbi:MAG: sugar phosphate isomerase/epimerase family protein [Bacillota bacterium]|nr:sugar phosphate isomerase/epimerase family protein [Bacillota bacterium]